MTSPSTADYCAETEAQLPARLVWLLCRAVVACHHKGRWHHWGRAVIPGAICAPVA